MEVKTKNDELVKKIINIFGEPNENELAMEIEKAKQLHIKAKSLISILAKYEKKTLDKKVCKDMLEDIISILLRERKDFYLLMDIYMNTTDEITSESLRKHFILKKTKPKKMEDPIGNDNNSSNGYIKFGIGLSCLFDNDKYYHKFIKGMLKYMQLCFEKEYLYEYLQEKYFTKYDKSSEYTKNIESFEYSLKNMVNNMRRFLSAESNDKVSLQEKDNNKMTQIKYRTLCVRAGVQKIEDVLNIYDKCKDNEEIVQTIEKLNKDNEKILVLLDLVQDYIKIEESEKQKKKLEKALALKDTELFSNSKGIKALENNINELRRKTNELETKDKEKTKEVNALKKKDEKNTKEINALTQEINTLKKKVDYIEPIVIALISRKVINYSICKICDKYRTKISIVVNSNNRNEPNYKISFIDSVNEVNKDDANEFLDFLFDKKSLFNFDSHLEGKKQPPFITDIWELVKNNLNFEKKELMEVFDKIITEEIKSGFDFGAHDLSINDYLKNENL